MNKLTLFSLAAAVASLLLPAVQNLIAKVFGYVEWRVSRVIERAKQKKRKKEEAENGRRS